MNTNLPLQMIPKFLPLVIMAFLVPTIAFAQADYRDWAQLSSTGEERGHAVIFSPDAQRLFVGTSRGIHILHLPDLKSIRFIPTETWVRALDISPDGTLLASGSYDPVVRLWWTKDGTLAQELYGHTGWVRELAFSPNGDLLATASDDNTVRIWILPEGETQSIIEKNTDGVRAVAFSPDGSLLATGGFDKIIRLWRVSDGSLVRELKSHTDWVRTLAFSPDGVWIASGAFDATVRLWQVTNGKLMVTRWEHTSSVLGLAFSPDGKKLASASVDHTVRMWSMPQVEPYALLKGHNDFVFAVEFAPDGKTLASTGVDNSVRIWDVPDTADPKAVEVISAPTICQACHHPLGSNTPPRVIETRCATCHQEGALSFNWCQRTVRPPTSGETTMRVTSSGTTTGLVLPHQAEDLTVVIASPGNGEHMYTQENIVSTVKVVGQIVSSSIPIEDIKLYLEILSGDETVASLTTQPHMSGYYSFQVNLPANENGLKPNDRSFRSRCKLCHLSTKTILPTGETRLVVTAIASDGSRAFDQRLIYVNRSEIVILRVNVMTEDNQSVSGVNVQATARLYEWRGRDFLAQSNADGQAVLQVEALSLVPTTYQIAVRPTIINGILYESVAPVEVVLPAGATNASPVNLQLRATHGQISGELSPVPAGPVDIAAINLPEGLVSQVVSTSKGSFTFNDIPIDRYLLTANLDQLALESLTVEPKEINLLEQPHATIELSLSEHNGHTLSGTTRQRNGSLLPFAFISLGESEVVKSSLPATSSYIWHDVPFDVHTLLVSVPGFYSRAYSLENANEQPLDVMLTRRPETRFLEWGSGSIVVPAETSVTDNGLDLWLERGWLWGQGRAAQPLTIQTGQFEIIIPQGEFALENLPGRAGWFYMLDGQASIRWKDNLEMIHIVKEQMVILTEGVKPVPVPYDPLVVEALHPDGDLPFELIWEPSLGAQIRDRFALAGMTTAKAITLVTYLMIILSISVIPLVMLYWWKKRRKTF